MILIAAALAVLVALGCSDTTNVPTRIMRRPVSIAVTCEDATGAPVALADCGETGNVARTWGLDADAQGLSIATAPGGTHFDADLFQPGFTSLPVGGVPVVVRSTTTSDLVIVALRSDATTGKPAIAWMRPKDLVPGLELARAPLPCAPIDVQVAYVPPTGGGEGVRSILVAYNCAAFVGIAAFPVVELPETAEPRPGERRWALPAAPRAFSVRADGAVAWISLAGSLGDSVGRLDLAKATDDATAIQVAAIDRPAPVPGLPVPGCPADAQAGLGSRILGAPTATPDGAFVYVPLARPAAMAVLDDGMNRIDVNAPVAGVEGSGSPLLQRLGIRDLELDGPARAIVMVDLGNDTDGNALGIRAYVAQQSGFLSRVVVTPNADNPVPHQQERTLEDGVSSDVDSTALMPALRVDGLILTRSVVQNPEYPSFGMPDIETDPDRTEKSVYYGVRFGGDLDGELTETWDVTYEGVIPGTSGCGALEAEPGAASAAFFRDPSADFCALGVMEANGTHQGDVLVVTPDPQGTCALSADEVLEYRIVGVQADRLALEPAYVSVPLPPAGCQDGRALRYEIRASESWTVVGTRTGFLHNRTSEGGLCVARADADSRFTGRALTTLPEDGGALVAACPVRLGDTKIGGNLLASRFTNTALSFNVVPGCKTDSKFRPVWIPPTRDTRLSFQATSGSVRKSVTLGGLPEEMVVAGTSIFALDSGTGVVYRVDASAETVSDSWY
jgi:hypothetical protein